jgi:2-deoxy-D-gluconate 3-dehydrogenase
MRLFSLNGKIAAITGADKGLGKKMAEALAEAGADIVMAQRSAAPETAQVITALGRRCAELRADLSRPETMEELADNIIAAFGRVDILVNNAGVTPVHPAEEYPASDLDLVMNVNVKSLYLLTQAVGQDMIRRGWGRIINVCSVQSFKGGRNVSAYVASKHAAAGITKAFANEWGAHGVTVNGIAPGFMVTDNTALLRSQPGMVEAIAAKVPLGRWGQAEDLMGPVVFLASEASAYINGHLLVVDGGYLND